MFINITVVRAKLQMFFIKLEIKLKNWINSVKIPALVDLFFKPLDNALEDAPKENWDRLGLGNKSAIGLSVWILFAILAICIIIYFLKDSLIFFINIVGFAIPVALLIIILYFILKSFK